MNQQNYNINQQKQHQVTFNNNFDLNKFNFGSGYYGNFGNATAATAVAGYGGLNYAGIRSLLAYPGWQFNAGSNLRFVQRGPVQSKNIFKIKKKNFF